MPTIAGYTYKDDPRGGTSERFTVWPDGRNNPINVVFGSRSTDQDARTVADNYRSVVGWDPGCLFFMDPERFVCPNHHSYVGERLPDGTWRYLWAETAEQVVRDEMFAGGDFNFSRRSHIRLWDVPVDLAGSPEAGMYRAGRSAYASAHHESGQDGEWHKIDEPYEDSEDRFSRQYIDSIQEAIRVKAEFRNAAPGRPDDQYNDGVPTLMY